MILMPKRNDFTAGSLLHFKLIGNAERHEKNAGNKNDILKRINTVLSLISMKNEKVIRRRKRIIGLYSCILL